MLYFFTDTDLHNVIKKGNILKDIHKRYIMYQVMIFINAKHMFFIERNKILLTPMENYDSKTARKTTCLMDNIQGFVLCVPELSNKHVWKNWLIIRTHLIPKTWRSKIVKLKSSNLSVWQWNLSWPLRCFLIYFNFPLFSLDNF